MADLGLLLAKLWALKAICLILISSEQLIYSAELFVFTSFEQYNFLIWTYFGEKNRMYQGKKRGKYVVYFKTRTLNK